MQIREILVIQRPLDIATEPHFLAGFRVKWPESRLPDCYRFCTGFAPGDRCPVEWDRTFHKEAMRERAACGDSVCPRFLETPNFGEFTPIGFLFDGGRKGCRGSLVENIEAIDSVGDFH